jgi:hypothetical protein
MKYLNGRKGLIAILSIVIVVAISIIAFLPKPNKTEQEAFLTQLGVNGLSVKDMVSKLDSIIDEPQGSSASISGTQVTLMDNDKKYIINLPSDSFYLAMAPYINSVHPCTRHNLVSCLGELFNQEFDVNITTKDGKVILNQKMKSMKNGFFGVWLPKKIEGTLTIKYGDLSVSKNISTFDESDTCLTTPLQLS